MIVSDNSKRSNSRWLQICVLLCAMVVLPLSIASAQDANAKDNRGFTPLDATTYDRESEKEARLEIAELLREKGGKSGAIQTNR